MSSASWMGSKTLCAITRCVHELPPRVYSVLLEAFVLFDGKATKINEGGGLPFGDHRATQEVVIIWRFLPALFDDVSNCWPHCQSLSARATRTRPFCPLPCPATTCCFAKSHTQNKYLQRDIDSSMHAGVETTKATLLLHLQLLEERFWEWQFRQKHHTRDFRSEDGRFSTRIDSTPRLPRGQSPVSKDVRSVWPIDIDHSITAAVSLDRAGRPHWAHNRRRLTT